jgi:hypothetical protein
MAGAKGLAAVRRFQRKTGRTRSHFHAITFLCNMDE